MIQKEPGSKYEGFLACVINELRGSGEDAELPALHFRCAGVTNGRQLQNAIELASGATSTVFGNALRQNGECLIVLDDLDYATPGSSPEPPTIDETIETIQDFCPNVSVVRVTALPCPATANPVRIGRLDVADTRSYLNRAPKSVQLSSPFDYTRVHRVTGGIPIYLDAFVAALDVTDLEGAIAEADAQPAATGAVLHESIVKEINDLRDCTADEMRRARALLWTLTILEQGESLGSLKRLSPRAPIWPKNAAHLQTRGCLESVTVTSRLSASGRTPHAAEGDKILRIPRLVRDYVLSVMTREEREDTVRSVAKLYFSDDWRTGVVRMRRRLAVGTEISTHQSGNELAVLKSLLQSPEVYFESPAVAFRLALSYVSQLESKGFFGEAYEAAKDTLAIVDGKDGVYDKGAVYHMHLQAAKCARMVGEREACVRYLQTAMPSVRASEVKDRLTSALVNLAMALLSLNRKAEARVAAEEVVKVAAKDSADCLQAKATLAEITMERPAAVRYLKKLASRAKNLGHLTVADNVMLEIASDSDNTEEKLKAFNEIKSRREMTYNFVRATIRRVETLLGAGRAADLTGVDREDLLYSYQLAYSQRMSNIFDWCHKVYWRYLTAIRARGQLGELFMYSSFVWRLSPTAVVNLVVSLRVCGSGSAAPGAGVPAATATTRELARPLARDPTPTAGAASALPGRSTGSASRPLLRRLGDPRPDHRDDRQREQSQRHVPMPPGPTAHLVLVQPAVALGQLEQVLDRPPRPRDEHQLVERRGRRSAAGEVRHLTRVRHAPPDQHPPRVLVRFGAVRRRQRPVVDARPLRPTPATEPVPGVGRNAGQQRPDPHLAEPGPNGEVGPHPDHIPQPVALGGCAEVVIGPVHRVGRHPPRRHTGLHRPIDHPPRQYDLGSERDLFRNAGLLPPLGVVGPLLGQVQGAVEQRPALLSCVPEEHPDLAVLDPPGGARVLAGNPTRLGALLEEPGLVHDQHPVGVAQVPRDVPEQVVANGVRVPVGPGQQVLDAVGRRVAQVLGQLPPVLPLRAAQKAAHVPNSSAPRFAPGEVATDALADHTHFVRPSRHLLACRSS